MTTRRGAPRRIAPRPLAPRILGAPVAPLLPPSGPVYVLLIGEAPGPRGADKSGVPFFGDNAGKSLYQVLRAIGAVTVPQAVDDLPWDGAAFAAAGLRPTAHGLALGNAYNACPTDDGAKFRTPTKTELESDTNLSRLRQELCALQTRGLRGVVTMGRVAAKTMDAVFATLPSTPLVRSAVVHPSAQGLLSMAPNRGRGARMADLQLQWRQQCCDAIVAAGYPDIPDRRMK